MNTNTNASTKHTDAIASMCFVVPSVKRHQVLENHGSICLDEPAKTYRDNEVTTIRP